MPWYSVVLILAGLVMVIAAIVISKNDQGDVAFLGIVGALLIGWFFIGHYMVREHAGQPISEFHDRDYYKIVSFSTVSDDNTAVIGLRKLCDGREGCAFTTPDNSLRIYRVPKETPFAKMLSSGKIKLPVNVDVSMVGRIPSFKLGKTLQPAKK